MHLSPNENFNAALQIIDSVWAKIADYPEFRDPTAPLQRLPDLSFDAAVKRAELGRDLLDRIAAINVPGLPYDLPCTLEIARRIAEQWSREAQWYWLVFDPTGCGFYGMFAPTAYCGGFCFQMLTPWFRGYPFESAGDGDRYVGLVHDYGRLARQMLERSRGQAERGIHMPQAQLAQAILLIKGLRGAVEKALIPESARLAAVDGERLIAAVSVIVADEVLPAFDAFVAFLEDPATAAAAPETVGLSQYPGGSEVYAALVRWHTTLELSPEQVHATGLRRMADIQAQMRALLDGAGFAGNPQEYLEQTQADPRWRASGAEAIAAVFQRYIDRIAPRIETAFNFKPKAVHSIAPLPEALELSMTFGYYTPPTATEQRGLFVFNTANLSQGPLNNLGPLTYHELVPGHHFHIASQFENDTLHPLRRRAMMINAFNEGWAEYAATLAGELGMYIEPEERFGRMMMDAFLTCRLVVDTGMNAFGWSLDRARDYVRANGFMPEKEVRSETVRYSCDIPGQALAYKLGDTALIEAREAMRAALGSHFDIRDFHDAVLKPGALPLPLVRRNVEAETMRLKKQVRQSR